MRHVVMFSFGIGSWAEAKLTVARHGAANTVLLSADTRMEDEDTYAWGEAAAKNVGAELVRVADGRDPWDVFFDVRYLGNTRIDPCSRILKRELCRAWLEEYLPHGGNVLDYTPGGAVIHVGIHASERERLSAIAFNYSPYRLESLLNEPPLIAYQDLHRWAEREGLWTQRLYRLGFPHANCGGFCVKAGHAHFKLLLETMPERYAYHEFRERELRAYLGKDVAILRDRKGGKTRPLTLREFRERLQAGGQCDLFDWGACSCFAGPEPEGAERRSDSSKETSRGTA